MSHYSCLGRYVCVCVCGKKKRYFNILSMTYTSHCPSLFPTLVFCLFAVHSTLCLILGQVIAIPYHESAGTLPFPEIEFVKLTITTQPYKAFTHEGVYWQLNSYMVAHYAL